MSIKAVHFCFVILTTLLALGLSGGLLAAYVREGGTVQLLLGLTALLVAIGLVGYFRSMRRKLKDVSLL